MGRFRQVPDGVQAGTSLALVTMRGGLTLQAVLLAVALVVAVGAALTWPWAARQMNEVFPPSCHGVGIYPERDADGYWVCADWDL